MATKDTKKVVEKEKDVLLLSEEEFERRRRAKNKEQINRVLRVVGLFAVILIIYAGVLDPFFEMSFFGFIFDRESYNTFWKEVWPLLSTSGKLGESNLAALINASGPLATLYDDPMWFGDWLVKLAITLIIIVVVLGVVYLITYNIIDLVSAIKGLLSSSRDVVRDLRGTITDSAEREFGSSVKKGGPKKKLFGGDDFKKEKKDETEKRKQKARKDDTIYDGLSDDQLDALLRGESLENVQRREEEEQEKKLFE